MAGKGWFKLEGAFAGWWLAPSRFALHEETGTVVLSDVHLGAEVSLARQGMYLPDTSSHAIARAWEQVLNVKPARLVIAGDLFDAVSPDLRAVRLFADLLEMLPGTCDVVLTPGNHDPEAAWLREMFESLRIEPSVVHGAAGVMERGGRVTVTHGHIMPAGAMDRLIVGHQHPAVRVATRVQAAKMMCFVRCRSGGREVLLLPPFSPLPLGSNLMNGRHWILDLPAPRPQEARIYGIVNDQVLDFGELAGIGS